MTEKMLRVSEKNEIQLSPALHIQNFSHNPLDTPCRKP
jgi:hypothetical protein